jgi:hypothetical protein
MEYVSTTHKYIDTCSVQTSFPKITPNTLPLCALNQKDQSLNAHGYHTAMNTTIVTVCATHSFSLFSLTSVSIVYGSFRKDRPHNWKRSGETIPLNIQQAMKKKQVRSQSEIDTVSSLWLQNTPMTCGQDLTQICNELMVAHAFTSRANTDLSLCGCQMHLLLLTRTRLTCRAYNCSYQHDGLHKQPFIMDLSQTKLYASPRSNRTMVARR